jgi:UDP-N-acetylmuramoyl-tripeptide--D-alanyl-D-alanine ligase
MIGSLSLSKLYPFMPTRIIGSDVSFARVNTDTRTLEAGDLFVALRGENFDGNRFAEFAQHKEAVAAIVSEPQAVDIPQLVVRDTVQALGWLGYLNRLKSDAIVVAITGSQGKTTVKELTGAILGRKHRTLVTRGNLNNSIGAPKMLLEIDESHQRVVIELGANTRGEIAWGTRITDPHIVLLNNAAETHVEGFCGLQGVVSGKGEIIDSAPSTHTVILNADDPHYPVWQQRAGNRRCVSFSGTGKASADYRAIVLDINSDSTRFELHTPAGSIVCELPLPGLHNVSNAVAAAALAIEAGAALVDAQAALSCAHSVHGRLEAMSGVNGSRLIDDSYNASPSSFRAAIEVLQQAAVSKEMQSVLIAGDMAELGELTEGAHRQLGEFARSLGVKHLWTVGSFTAASSAAFGQGAIHFDNKSSLAEHARLSLTAGHVALVKGSRSAAMDEIVKKIRNEEID